LHEGFGVFVASLQGASELELEPRRRLFLDSAPTCVLGARGVDLPVLDAGNTGRAG